MSKSKDCGVYSGKLNEKQRDVGVKAPGYGGAGKAIIKEAKGKTTGIVKMDK